MSEATPMYVMQDLDQQSTLRAALNNIASGNSTNFALYFDHSQATVTFDLTNDHLDQWTRHHNDKPGTKWIHFWTDQSQRPLVKAAVSKYKLSPRLTGLMCTQASEPPPSVAPDSQSSSERRGPDATRRKRPYYNDIESTSLETQMDSLLPKKLDEKGTSFGDIVSDLWHFHSVDWDHNYVHIGVNTLAAVPDVRHISGKPAGKRLWTSIVLCHDGTVISTLERPYFTGDVTDVRVANKMVNRHILSIVSRLSRLVEDENENENDLMNVRIRPGKGHPDPSGPDHSQRTECASLLSYYLFDDWMSTYALIARREHPYRERLERVRRDLTKAPDVQLLETLHDIGRQLNVLRSMYQSYATVVTRVLARHRRNWPTTVIPTSKQPLHATQSNGGRTISTTLDQDFTSDLPPPHQERSLTFTSSIDNLSYVVQPSHDHIQISNAALFRFERLLDRINLYALSEIDHCISEKDSLDFMTFNLLQLSESRTVEKLTRTTVLLAKATIVFLPISLQTAYFGIQVGNIEQNYTLKSYWLSFLVVTVVAVVFLVVFSALTETVQGQLLYQSVHKVLWVKGVSKLAARRTARQ